MADRPCYLRKATGRRRRAQAEGRTGDEEARCQGSGRLTLPEAGRPRLARFEVISMHRHLRAGRALAVAMAAVIRRGTGPRTGSSSPTHRLVPLSTTPDLIAQSTAA